MSKGYVIGVDFGTDSVRALLLDAGSGAEIQTAVSAFKRWKEGKYINPLKHQFRQHPLDYIESLEEALIACLKGIDQEVKDQVLAISIDATGSSPVAVGKDGQPLALQERFTDNPNAMFFLWKDHSAIKEADEINKKAADFEINYLNYVGGIYSSEWFWSKLLYLARKDKEVFDATYTWVEQSDWLPYLLTGAEDVNSLKRNVCAAGHKALWAAEFEGYPDRSFFTYLDPELGRIYDQIDQQVYSADAIAGELSSAWASKLGLSTNVKVGVGAIDAHVGAIGAQIEPGYMCKVMGTSTCDMMVISKNVLADRLVQGICGQVQGSIVPDLIGLEAGQSAFGDVYSWFRQLLLWPVTQLVKEEHSSGDESWSLLLQQLEDQLLTSLSKQAAAQELDIDSCISLDWFNGRRTPNVDPHAKGAIFDMSLGTDAVQIFQALVEATCFGSRAIVAHVEEQGVKIEGVIAIGGIAKKSPYVMQTLADVLQRPIKVHQSNETCALGACMLAATVAGVYGTVEEAMKALGPGFEQDYLPDPSRKDHYDIRYQRYLAIGKKVY